MKILAFAASLRKDSYNRKLIRRAADFLATRPGVEVDLADFRDFEMPIYDGDAEDATGLPAGAQELVRRLEKAQAVVISTPEYNGGIAGTLKNALDWSSRKDPMPWDGKPVLLIGASPGALGAVRGLWHTRQPFEVTGALVYPEVFGLPRASAAFDEAGKFADAKNQGRLEELLTTYVDYANRLTAGR